VQQAAKAGKTETAAAQLPDGHKFANDFTEHKVSWWRIIAADK